MEATKMEFMLASLNPLWPDLKMDGVHRRVGRSPTVDVQMSDSRISSVHVTFTADRRVTDSSTNGVWVNGKRMTRGETRALCVGDVITLCAPTPAQCEQIFGTAHAAWRVEGPRLTEPPVSGSEGRVQQEPSAAAPAAAAAAAVASEARSMQPSETSGKPIASGEPAPNAAPAARAPDAPTLSAMPRQTAEAALLLNLTRTVNRRPAGVPQAQALVSALTGLQSKPPEEEAWEQAEGQEEQAGNGSGKCGDDDDDDEFDFKEVARPKLSSAWPRPGVSCALGKRSAPAAVVSSAAARPRLMGAGSSAHTGVRSGSSPCSDGLPKAHANLASIFAHLRGGRAA